MVIITIPRFYKISTRLKSVSIAKTSDTQQRCVAKRKTKLKRRNLQEVVVLEATLKQGSSGIKQLETEEEKSCDSEGANSGAKEDDIYQIYRCEVRREDPLFISPRVNEKQMKMELDTGAALSVTGNKKFRQDHPGVELRSTNSKLRTYSGECITPVGIADVEVNYEGQSEKLPLVVTPGDTPTLLGRNWLKQLQIDWNKVFAVLQVEIKGGIDRRS